MDVLTLRPLTRRQIGQAFALIRTEMPEAVAGRWRSFALARSGPGPGGGVRDRGIMTVQNQTGYILGLFVFDVRDDLRDGRTLAVSHLAVPGLVGRGTLARHLVEGVITIAQLNDCRMIDVTLPEAQAELTSAFRHSGFTFDALH